MNEHAASVHGQQSLRLTSPRCVLDPLTSLDLEELHGVWSSAGVRRFLWDGEVIPIVRTGDAIARSTEMFGAHGYGLWGARLACEASLCGFGGFWPFRDPPEVELLYGVDERLWGGGLATEIAQAVVAYGFDALRMPVVRASTDAANVASVRVLEKLGFVFVGRGTLGGLDTVFYELRNARGAAR